MFHTRYQKLSAVGWGEKRKLIDALEAFESGLATKAQAAAQRYVLVAFQGPLEPDADDRKHLSTAIEALQAAYQHEPMAIYALKLSEYYMYLERFVEGVEVLKQSIAAAPTDVRLLYALGTIYRILGRARRDEAETMFAPGVLDRGVFLASPVIEDACSHLRLTVEDARKLAAEHFSQVLKLNVHPSERASVEESLQIMREMLQGRVRALWEE